MRRELPTASQGITEYDQKSIKDCFSNLDHRRRKHLTSDKNSGPNKVTLIKNEKAIGKYENHLFVIAIQK